MVTFETYMNLQGQQPLMIVIHQWRNSWMVMPMLITSGKRQRQQTLWAGVLIMTHWDQMKENSRYIQECISQQQSHFPLVLSTIFQDLVCYIEQEKAEGRVVVEKLDLSKYDPKLLNMKQKMAFKRVKQWVKATSELPPDTPPTQLLLQIQGKYIHTMYVPTYLITLKSDIIIVFRQGWIWQELLSGLFTSLCT